MDETIQELQDEIAIKTMLEEDTSQLQKQLKELKKGAS